MADRDEALMERKKEPPESPATAPEPPPRPSDHPPVWEMVIADMRTRDAAGREEYGTPLRPHNGRVPLRDAYQEVLDLAVYIRQAIYEQEAGLDWRACDDGHPPIRYQGERCHFCAMMKQYTKAAMMYCEARHRIDELERGEADDG